MSLKTCPNGHQYYKNSDCPSCPVCEKERKPQDGLLSSLSAPARRALEGQRITTVQQLSKFTQKEILKLHGMGKASLPILVTALEKEGLSFRED